MAASCRLADWLEAGSFAGMSAKSIFIPLVLGFLVHESWTVGSRPAIWNMNMFRHNHSSLLCLCSHVLLDFDETKRGPS